MRSQTITQLLSQLDIVGNDVQESVFELSQFFNRDEYDMDFFQTEFIVHDPVYYYNFILVLILASVFSAVTAWMRWFFTLW